MLVWCVSGLVDMYLLQGAFLVHVRTELEGCVSELVDILDGVRGEGLFGDM